MSSGTSFTVKIEGMQELLRRIPDEARSLRVRSKLLLAAGKEVQKNAMLKVPRKSSATARSIHVEPLAPTFFIKVQGNAVVGYLEHGTGIHGPRGQRIFPTHSQSLRWPIGATTLSGRHKAGAPATFQFAKSTEGMKAQPFIKPAYEASMPFIETLIHQAGEELTKEGL